MKKVLTDSKTGKQFTILFENPYLPALGEDGIQYFLFQSNLTLWNGDPRDDCHVVDLNKGIAVKAETLPGLGIDKPIEYIFDKESFDAANSISEYVELIKQKSLLL